MKILVLKFATKADFKKNVAYDAVEARSLADAKVIVGIMKDTEEDYAAVIVNEKGKVLQTTIFE